MKVAKLIRSCLLMPWLALSSSCMASEPEAKIRERLIEGSSFDANHLLLRKDGWIVISDNGFCIVTSTQESKYIYVRESNPSYLLILSYSNACTLVSVVVRRRNNNEL